jgi:hypothetical protein
MQRGHNPAASSTPAEQKYFPLPGHDCVAAYGGDYRYELYAGNNTADERAKHANYQTGAAFPRLVFGWNSNLCQVEMQYICKVPATGFPCSSSSSSPSPSPAPKASPPATKAASLQGFTSQPTPPKANSPSPPREQPGGPIVHAQHLLGSA